MHNDTAVAVGNSLCGVKGGANMVQGCVNGYGERTGNADIIVVAANLELKMGIQCLPRGAIANLTRVASDVAKICKQSQDQRQAYVGSSAFAHKGGLHVAALQKMPSSYNHIVPGRVGNSARTVVSELSGRGNILSAAMASGRQVSKETAGVVLAQIKELESRGFVLEDAGATVDILFRRADPLYRAPFNVLEFNVSASNTRFGGYVLPADEVETDAVAGDRYAEEGAADHNVPMTGYKKGSVAMNQVVVKVEIFDYGDPIDAGSMAEDASLKPWRRHTELCVAEGNGPVNALARALRSALKGFPQLRRIHLDDYKVDLLSTEGTSAAVTRVTMDFVDLDTEQTWRTVGAHASIIEASFRALVDGMEYGIAQCSGDGCAVNIDDGRREEMVQ